MYTYDCRVLPPEPFIQRQFSLGLVHRNSCDLYGRTTWTSGL